MAIKFDKNAMIKKINPSPKMSFTSCELSEFRRGSESLTAVRTRMVKSKHME